MKTIHWRQYGAEVAAHEDDSYLMEGADFSDLCWDLDELADTQDCRESDMHIIVCRPLAHDDHEARRVRMVSVLDERLREQIHEYFHGEIAEAWDVRDLKDEARQLLTSAATQAIRDLAKVSSYPVMRLQVDDEFWRQFDEEG